MARKVLVIEDDESILTLILAIFASCDDYSVLCARDGEEGLRIAHADNPDIILLDARLPGVNGYEVCRSVKSDPATSHIKVVMLSALGQASDLNRALEAGVNGYVAKPFDTIALIAKVEKLLKSN